MNYFEGSIVSPASSGNVVLTGAGPSPGVELSSSVSGNPYDRTANVQLELDMSALALTEVAVHCTYRPQVGQRSYGPAAGEDVTSATVRSQYNSITAVFGSYPAPEVTVQAPLNDMIDALYPVDDFPFPAFDLVFVATQTQLSWSVNGAPPVVVPLEETSTQPLVSLRLTAFVSAKRFEFADNYYEGPYCLSSIVVKDLGPAPPFWTSRVKTLETT